MSAHLSRPELTAGGYRRTVGSKHNGYPFESTYLVVHFTGISGLVAGEPIAF